MSSFLAGLAVTVALLTLVAGALSATWLVKRALARPKIVPGDIYEDCGYHFCYCTTARVEFTRPMLRWLPFLFPLPGDYGIEGLSLATGNARSCSQRHCAPKLIDDQAQVAKFIQGRELLLACEARWNEEWYGPSYVPWYTYMGWVEDGA